MKFATVLAVVALVVGPSAAHSNGFTNPKPGCNMNPSPNCGALMCGCDEGSGTDKRWIGGGFTSIPRRFVEYVNGLNGKCSVRGSAGFLL